MPISTPESWLPKYSGDAQHFKHVLDHLFIPAIKKAGYDPVPPIAKGADLIHAEIIKHIAEADLVLCDMSTLNPNVFFELGIRTAVNRPVCIVKDNKTDNVPFDTIILNHHEYASDALQVWNCEEQTKKLVAHIQESANRSGKENTLWHVFGLTTRATLPAGKGSQEDKLELISLRIEGLSKQFDTLQANLDSQRQLHEIPPPSFGLLGSSLYQKLPTVPTSLSELYDRILKGDTSSIAATPDVIVSKSKK